LSKFDQILNAAKGRDKSSAKKASRSSSKSDQIEEAPARRRGRPATGKRNDPDYDQTTAYIRKDTYKAVRIALLEDGDGTEYSELVEELLSNWLKNRR
jgi:hypothetical protein